MWNEGARVSVGHLCTAETPTEPAGEIRDFAMRRNVQIKSIV